MSRLAGVSDKRHDSKRMPGVPSSGGRNVEGELALARTFVPNGLPPGGIVNKVEVHLVLKQRGPRVGMGTAQDNEIVVGLDVVKLEGARRVDFQACRGRAGQRGDVE